MIRKFYKFYSKDKASFGHRLSKSVTRELYKNSFYKYIKRRTQKRVIPKNWIFIVGNYNSGTTLLFDIIAAHKNVASLPTESPIYTDVFKRGDEIGWGRNWVNVRKRVALPSIMQPDRVEKLLSDLSPIWRNAKAAYFLDKTITNIERMLWIDKNLPNVKFIGLVRNGYASSEGMCRKSRPVGQAAHEYGKSEYDFSFAAQQWVMANEKMMENAEKVGGFMLVKYEDLVRDPKSMINDVFNYLNLRTDNYKVTGSEICVDSRVFNLKNMNDKSFAALSLSQISDFNIVAKDTMAKFNYSLL